VLTGQLLFVYFCFVKRLFFTLFYPSTSLNALMFALISFFLHSLTKAVDNNTLIKIISSSVSLEAMFVARFVAAAFWRGCGQIFVAAASCATKVRNKSLCVSSGLIHIQFPLGSVHSDYP